MDISPANSDVLIDCPKANDALRSDGSCSCVVDSILDFEQQKVRVGGTITVEVGSVIQVGEPGMIVEPPTLKRFMPPLGKVTSHLESLRDTIRMTPMARMRKFNPVRSLTPMPTFIDRS